MTDTPAAAKLRRQGMEADVTGKAFLPRTKVASVYAADRDAVEQRAAPKDEGIR